MPQPRDGRHMVADAKARVVTVVVYHGTPITPAAALDQLAGRSFCVSYYRRDCAAVCERIGARVATAEALAVMVGRLANCVRVEVRRPLERWFAEWRAEP